MSNMIRNLLLATTIVAGATLAAGQAAQASPLDVIESGFSIGLGDSGVEFGIGDEHSGGWDDDDDHDEDHH
jgi:hypothetical protein